MRNLVFVLLVACGSSSPPPSQPQPAPAQPAPAEPQVMTPQECEAAGGRVNTSIGGGDQPHCADTESELAPVRIGIEGGWCCKQK